VYLVNYNELYVYKCLLIKTYHVMVLLYNNNIMHLCALFYFIGNSVRGRALLHIYTTTFKGVIEVMLTIKLKTPIQNIKIK